MPRLARLLAACLLVATACTSGGDGDAATDEPADGGSPPSTRGEVTISDVAVEPGPNSTLSAVLTFTTSERTLPVVALRAGDRSSVVPSTDAATEHVVPLVAMRAETEYEITVGAIGADDPVVTSFTTGPLPEGMPRLELVHADPERVADGLTLFDAIPLSGPDPATTPPGEAPDAGWVIAVDADGEVVWYYRRPSRSATSARRRTATCCSSGTTWAPGRSTSSATPCGSGRARSCASASPRTATGGR